MNQNTVFIRTPDNKVVGISDSFETVILRGLEFSLTVKTKDKAYNIATLDTEDQARQAEKLFGDEIKSGNRFLDMSADIIPFIDFEV